MKEALACESRSFFCARSGRTAYGIVRDGCDQEVARSEEVLDTPLPLIIWNIGNIIR